MKFSLQYIVSIIFCICVPVLTGAQELTTIRFNDIEYTLYSPENKDILSPYLMQNDSCCRQYEGIISRFANHCSGHTISFTFYKYGLCLIAYDIAYIGYWFKDEAQYDRYVCVLGAHNYPQNIQNICSFYPDNMNKRYDRVWLHQVADSLLYIPELKTVVRSKK